MASNNPATAISNKAPDQLPGATIPGTRLRLSNGNTVYNSDPTPNIDEQSDASDSPVTPVGLDSLRAKQIETVIARLTETTQALPTPFSKRKLYRIAAEVGIPVWNPSQKQQFTNRILNRLDYQWDEATGEFVPDIGDPLVQKIITAAESIISSFDDTLTSSQLEAVEQWCTTHGIDSPESDSGKRIVARQAVFARLLEAVLADQSSSKELRLQRTPNSQNPDTRSELPSAEHKSESSVLNSVVRLADQDTLATVIDERERLLYSSQPSEDIGSLYEALIPSTARRSLGQFRTSSEIGATMQTWAASGTDTVLDPGMGPAALTTPTHPRWDVATDPETVIGIDRSPLSLLMGSTVQCLADQSHQTECNDFLALSPANLDADVDAIVCNPPYTKHHELPSTYKDTVNTAVEAETDRTISAASPLYVYFCYHVRQFLDPGDRAAIILPQSWLAAKFGETLKQFFTDEFRITGLVQFDPEGDQVFETADTTALIAFLEATDRDETDATTRFIRVNEWLGSATLRTAVNNGDTGETDWGFVNCEQQSQLSVDRNWQALFDPHEIDTSSLTPLGDLVTIRRGKTTGCVGFFCLSQDDIDATRLDERDLTRLIRRPTYIDGYDFRTADWRELRDEGKAVWLFDPSELPDVPSTPAAFKDQLNDGLTGQHDAESCEQSAVLEYLETGVTQHGLANVACLSDRPFWYRPRRASNRSVLVRSASRDGFRFLLNETNARHINNMCAFTDVTLGNNELKALLAFLNSDYFDLVVRDYKKVRDGGYEDISPNSLEAVPVLNPTTLPNDVVTRLAGLFDELRLTARRGGDCEEVHYRILEILDAELDVSVQW